ncbi:MAG: response regulator [Selenomonas sp.]|nr:response regulator [Selenomonas sp.]
MLQKNYERCLPVERQQEILTEIIPVLAEIKERAVNLKVSCLYLHIVFSGIKMEIGRQLYEEVREYLPQAVITGMAETLFVHKLEQVKVQINAMFWEEAQVELVEYNGRPDNYVTAGQNFGRRISAMPDVKAAFVYCVGEGTQFTKFLRELAAENPHCVISGAIVSILEDLTSAPDDVQSLFCLSKDMEMDYYYVVGREFLHSGITVAVFRGQNLHVRGDYVLGWKPVGKELEVTEMVGDTCVAKLDGMPATDIYKHYLQVTPDENFIFNICAFPLAVKRNGCIIARVPPVFDEEGRIYFSGDVYQGEKMQLTYAVPANMLQETDMASEKMCPFAPDGVVLTLCGNRSFFLKEEAVKELNYYRRFAPQLIANYGTSEIYCYEGQGGVLNSALVSVGFREGEVKALPDCYGEMLTEEKHYVIPLAARMAAFLDAVTQELAASNKELLAMAHAAKAASRAKSQFLSSMSHEIRTPINAVLGMDEMILRETQEKNTREYAQNIRTAGTALLSLVNDILDFSKIEAGKMAIIPVEYAVSSLLNDLVNMIRQRAEQKGLQFLVEIPDDMPSILKGDEIRLRQIAVNILTNAVKYTDEGRVTLRLSYEKLSDNRIALTTSVKDTGIGIKQEDIDKLFHAFERIEEERNRTIEGTGLGMNITQKLLAMMGSELKVNSVYGGGSEFSYTVEQEVLNWSPMGNYEEAYQRMMAAQTAYKESFVAPEARILVVDDTAINLTVVKGLLKQTQMQVDTAMSGYECLKMAGETAYDVIFLDHRMPGLDGIETLQRLQAMSKQAGALNADTPVVALTANAVSGAREEYMAAGFDDYLTKPIDSHQLEKLLRNMLPASKVRAAGQLAVAAEDKLPDWLEYVVGLDPYKGVEHCGSVAAYMDALKVFAQTIMSNAEEIQRYYDTGDWQNYTTKVHALKSTARIIGASELSEKAARLEDAGNNCYCDEIETGTAPLLELYRSFASSLSVLMPAEKEAAEKAPISPAELSEAWETLTEIVTSFDYDSLEYMLGELSGYQLPEAEAEKLAQLKKAAAVPEWDKLQQLLSIART